MANKIGIKIGGKLKLSIEGSTFEEKVIGLVEVPDHVYLIKDDIAIFPTHTDYGFVYLSVNEFPENYIYEKMIEINEMQDAIENKDAYIFPYLIVDVEDISKINETKTNIKNNVDRIVTLKTRDDNFSYERFKREAEEGETYLGVFSGLFVFIAILSVVTTMNRFVKKERTQIGTLKALGIRKSKITWMYVDYGFFISIVASVLGVVLGNLAIGNFFLEMEMEYS